MKRVFFLISLLLTLSLPLPIFAQQIILGDNQQYGVLAFRNPNASVGKLVASGIQIMAIITGLAVLVFLVWGAFDWVTSGGDKEKIAGARRKIINALIGLFLLALAAFTVTLLGEITGINPLSPSAKPLPVLGEPPTTTP